MIKGQKNVRMERKYFKEQMKSLHKIEDMMVDIERACLTLDRRLSKLEKIHAKELSRLEKIHGDKTGDLEKKPEPPITLSLVITEKDFNEAFLKVGHSDSTKLGSTFNLVLPADNEPSKEVKEKEGEPKHEN